MTEQSSDLIVNSDSRHQEFSNFSESLFDQPVLEKEITTQIIHDYCIAHDSSMDVSVSDDNQLYISKVEDKLSVKLPENPTLDDFNQFVEFLSQEDFENYGQEIPGYSQLLAEKYSTLAKLIYCNTKSRTLSRQDQKISISRDLIKISRKLTNQSELTNDQIITLLEQQDIKEPGKEFFVWFFLGGRDSAAYKKLHLRYWENKVTSESAEEKRWNLKHQILIKERSGAPQEEVLELKKQWLKMLQGPDEKEFEDYLMRKKGFLEKVITDYVGGQRTTNAITEASKTALTQDFKQAVWGRGMTRLMKKIHQDTDTHWMLADFKNISKRLTFGRENILSKTIQQFIDRLPVLHEKLNLQQRFEDLNTLRHRHYAGEISQEDLVKGEESWLQSLHDEFTIPYDKDVNVLSRATSGEIPGFKTYHDVDSLKCVYQAELHGFILMRAFGTYAAHCEDHKALFVEKSDGSYSFFDNSGGILTHIDKSLVGAHEISKHLMQNTNNPVWKPKSDFKIGSRIVNSSAYFAENYFEDVDSASLQLLGSETRFSRSRSNYRGKEFVYQGRSFLDRYKNIKKKSFVSWLQNNGVNLSTDETRWLDEIYPNN